MSTARSSCEEPLRADEHQSNEQRERQNIRPLGGRIVSADRDDLADDKGSDEAAHHIAEPAQHANDEDERSEGVANKWMDVVLQHQERGTEASERSANGRSDEVNAPRVDPHQSH